MSIEGIPNINNSDNKISRRDFLKLVGVAGTIATLPTFLPLGKVFGTNGNLTTTNNNTKTATKISNGHHKFNLDGTSPQVANTMGSRTMVDSKVFPILEGMAIGLVILKKGGVREPHWHPNASELGFCISGKTAMTMFGPDNSYNRFTIDAGELSYVPIGWIHDIENIGDTDAKFLVVFNNDKPEDLGISGSIGSMQNRVLNSTFNINPPTFFNQFNDNSPKNVVVGPKPNMLYNNEKYTRIANNHKFDLANFPPQIQTAGGSVALGNANAFPILNGLACYMLKFKPHGIREPHWHPNAPELNYVVEGKARLTVFSPGGSAGTFESGYVDTFEVSAGEIAFIPQGYFHYIENINNNSNTTFLVFFGSERPQDIGISGSFSAYSNGVLGSVFNTNPNLFTKLPRLQQDVFLVSGAG